MLLCRVADSAHGMQCVHVCTLIAGYLGWPCAITEHPWLVCRRTPALFCCHDHDRLPSLAGPEGGSPLKQLTRHTPHDGLVFGTPARLLCAAVGATSCWHAVWQVVGLGLPCMTIVRPPTRVVGCMIWITP